MKKPLKTILILTFSIALAFSLAACGGSGSSADQETTVTIPDATNTNTSDKPSTPDPSSHKAENGKDVSTDALDACTSAKPGSTEKLSGKYAINDEKSKSYYVFGEDASYIYRNGVYEPQGGKVILQWGSDDGWDYEVSTASKGSYYLMRNGQLQPLTFKDGFDGLSGDKLFSGVYQPGDTETNNWVFAKDGSLSEVTSLDAKVKGDKVTIANSEYTWKAKDGKILIQSDGETVMTLIPAE